MRDHTGPIIDKTRCAAAVWGSGAYRSHQCTRRRGFGPDGQYCKQHDPVRIAELEAKRSEKRDKTWNEFQQREEKRRRDAEELQRWRDFANTVLNAYEFDSRNDKSAIRHMIKEVLR